MVFPCKVLGFGTFSGAKGRCPLKSQQGLPASGCGLSPRYFILLFFHMEELKMADKFKVLLVDDDPDFVEATKLILEKKGGYSVVVAYDGNEGLEKCKEENPDIIVLDVMMPEKDGYEMCADLKADKKLSNIPIILLTAVASHISDTKYTQRMGMETEADDYLDKPAEPNVILERVNALLKKK